MEDQIKKYFEKLVEPFHQIEDLSESQYMQLILTIDLFGTILLIPIVIFRLIFYFSYQDPLEFVFTPVIGLITFLLSWILGKTKYYKISYNFILFFPFLLPFTQLSLYFSDYDTYTKIVNVILILALSVFIAGILYPYKYIIVVITVSLIEIFFFYGILLEYELNIVLFKMASFVAVGSFTFLAIYTRRSVLKKLEDLRDKYSHDLGNNLQTIHFAAELIGKTEQNPQVSKALALIEKKLNEAGDLITEIRKLN